MLYDLMRKRRSIRRFKNRVPSREQLEQIIAAAITAPSASNKQPWKFLLVSNRLMIDQAAALVEQEIERLTPLLSATLRRGFSEYAGNFTAFAGAPTLIIPIYRVFPLLSQLFAEARAEEEATARKLEGDSALISVACAIQNMLLVIEEMGLGACCMTGPLLAANSLAGLFRVPAGWEIAAVIPLGYPDETPALTTRKALELNIKWFPEESCS